MFDNKRLKERRLSLGLTLEDVGAKVGIGRSGVQKYEKGTIKNIYTATVERFSEALHCSPAYLMGWTDEIISVTQNSKISLDPNEFELIKKYRALDERGQILVNNVIDSQLEAIYPKMEDDAG